MFGTVKWLRREYSVVVIVAMDTVHRRASPSTALRGKKKIILRWNFYGLPKLVTRDRQQETRKQTQSPVS